MFLLLVQSVETVQESSKMEAKIDTSYFYSHVEASQSRPPTMVGFVNMSSSTNYGYYFFITILEIKNYIFSYVARK